MNQPSIRWRPWPLVTSLLIAAGLFVTFVAPDTSVLWHWFDVRTALDLNGDLASNPAMQFVWAYGNMRGYDYAMAVIMLALLMHYTAFGARQTAVSVRAAQAVVVCFSVALLAVISKNVIFEGLYPRDSPSLVLHPFTILDNVTGLGAKDSSSASFPGDHTIVGATFTYLLWSFAGRRYGLAALIIAIFASLPRLVAGAHWMTDDIVGGLGAALITVPWIVYTPVGPWLTERLSGWLERLPGIPA